MDKASQYIHVAWKADVRKGTKNPPQNDPMDSPMAVRIRRQLSMSTRGMFSPDSTMATFVNGAYVHSADANTSRAANMNHTDCINVPAANSTKAMPYNPRLKPMQYVDVFPVSMMRTTSLLMGNCKTIPAMASTVKNSPLGSRSEEKPWNTSDMPEKAAHSSHCQ